VQLALAAELPMVEVDRVQIHQVLVNLLQNAYEALDAAKMQRRIVIVRTAMAQARVHVSVADTGPGLPTDTGADIFDAFVTTKTDGLGMGLAISKTIVESHGGKLWAEANPDGGTVFRFTLPVVNERQVDGKRAE
jgi:C4-dicarboxylate-specific signal transduction histidine kinase